MLVNRFFLSHFIFWRHLKIPLPKYFHLTWDVESITVDLFGFIILCFLLPGLAFLQILPLSLTITLQGRYYWLHFTGWGNCGIGFHAWDQVTSNQRRLIIWISLDPKPQTPTWLVNYVIPQRISIVEEGWEWCNNIYCALRAHGDRGQAGSFSKLHSLPLWPSLPEPTLSDLSCGLSDPETGLTSVQFSRSVVSDSLRPHESQHARPPCPSPTPGVHSDSRPSSQWCHPAISSSVVPFFCPQSLPASESFPVSRLFAWGGQSTGVSALASFLPKKSQGWSSEWTGWISLLSKGLSRVFSNTTVQKHQFFGAQPSSQSNFHIHTWPLEKP